MGGWESPRQQQDHLSGCIVQLHSALGPKPDPTDPSAPPAQGQGRTAGSWGRVRGAGAGRGGQARGRPEGGKQEVAAGMPAPTPVKGQAPHIRSGEPPDNII